MRYFVPDFRGTSDGATVARGGQAALRGLPGISKSLNNSGHFVGGNRLMPPETAITVRVRKGKVTTTDGPWVETREQLGGYYLIDARDLNEAIQIAARIPGAWIGCVEVRPIADDAETLEVLALAGPGKSKASNDRLSALSTTPAAIPRRGWRTRSGRKGFPRQQNSRRP